MAFDIFYPNIPDLPLPKRHRFPAQKYRMLYETLCGETEAHGFRFSQSPMISRDDLYRSHSRRYVDAIFAGTLSEQEQKKIALPWSEILLRRSRSAVGGSLAASRLALQVGAAGQLAGGTHHAHHDFGSGFCVFNDLAVTARVLQHECSGLRIAILDLDVHQGDGNAALLRDDPETFVVSVHGARNFPFEKEMSDLDIALPDGADDTAYMIAVDQALAAISAFRPNIILYISGVDPLVDDRLGRLSVSMDGLGQRDRRVLSYCHDHNTPVAIVVGGGYAEPISRTVEAYANTFRIAASVYKASKKSLP